jgi:hypothetical protein
MKSQTTKQLSAFFVTMFSVAIMNAQCGPNKVLMHPAKSCITKCVPSSQVDKYISQGWVLGYCTIVPFIAKNKIKPIDKPLAKIPTDYDRGRNKIFRK